MSRDTDMLREEIEQTRERMSDTLDQLGERLNPNRIKQQVKDNVREATIGRVEDMARHASVRVNETREGLLGTIRDNPVPAAMIGIGLGLMLFNGRRDSRSHTHSLQASELGGDGYIGNIDGVTPRLMQDDAAGGIGASVSHDHTGGIRSHVSDVAVNAREKVSDVAQRAGERISEVKETASEKVGDAAHRVQHVASDLAQTTRYQAHRAEDRFASSMQDNPLAVGAVAIALGMAAGFAIPETRRENEILGPTRDKLVDRARVVASEAKERAHEVVGRVKEAAEDELSSSSSSETRSPGYGPKGTTGYSSSGIGSTDGSTLL
jgi:ElaB/YqjD/DUF883 family membrane-anchored ribosome-binding protein